MGFLFISKVELLGRTDLYVSCADADKRTRTSFLKLFETSCLSLCD